jgi:hypothetical protein
VGLLGLPLLLATAAAGAAADGVGGGRPLELSATTWLPDDAEQKENSGTLMYCAKGFMFNHKIPKRGITGDKRGVLGRGNLTQPGSMLKWTGQKHEIQEAIGGIFGTYNNRMHTD